MNVLLNAMILFLLPSPGLRASGPDSLERTCRPARTHASAGCAHIRTPDRVLMRPTPITSRAYAFRRYASLMLLAPRDLTCGLGRLGGDRPVCGCVGVWVCGCVHMGGLNWF
jgi:hypothetical protein